MKEKKKGKLRNRWQKEKKGKERRTIEEAFSIAFASLARGRDYEGGEKASASALLWGRERERAKRFSHTSGFRSLTSEREYRVPQNKSNKQKMHRIRNRIRESLK